MMKDNKPSIPLAQILVVSASEMVLCGLTNLLAAAGYAVQGLPDPGRARKMAGIRRFDLVILQAASADASFADLARFLEQSRPAVPVLHLRELPNPTGSSFLGAVAEAIGQAPPPSPPRRAA